MRILALAALLTVAGGGPYSARAEGASYEGPSVAPAPGRSGGGGKIKWRTHKGYDGALTEARESGKPLMLYFTADF